MSQAPHRGAAAWLGRDALFDPLRRDPRFRALVRALNFAD